YGAAGEMLYDHRTDPQENHNLAAVPAYAAELTRHRALLKAQMDLAAAAKVGPRIKSADKSAGKDDADL
ncbi:MAG: hypothetical protein ABIQ12_11175, partial [Opitutaceae bacterium]